MFMLNIIIRIRRRLFFCWLSIIKNIDYRYTAWYVRKCKIRSTKVVFSNFFGKGYGDNPKYLADEIIRQNLNWDLVWLVNNNEHRFPKEIRTVEYGSLAAQREMASAGFWVDNVRNSDRPEKKDNQTYIQTWHGGLGFKKAERAVENTLNKEYVAAAKKDGEICDAIVSSCALVSEEYRKYFWLNNKTEILETGLPRNDVLFNSAFVETKSQEVKRFLRIEEGTKVVLYMPTFRDDFSISGYQLDFEGIIREMENKFSERFVVVIRLHPNVRNQSDFIQYSDVIINGTLYPDAQELYMAADYLITDYSSAAFDFALLDRPVFLCALDFDKYQSDRGLSQVFHDCPFPHTYSNHELLEAIRHFSEEKYRTDMKAYKETWNPFDEGHAAEQIVNWMKEKIQ